VDLPNQTVVHVLQHIAETQFADEERLIGAFAEPGTAEAAIELLRSKVGFCECPDGFGVDEYRVDHDYWPEGFAWEDSAAVSEGPCAELRGCIPLDPKPNLFVLEHRRLVGSRVSRLLIGFYSSHETAVAAAYRSSTKPGFRSFLDGFLIAGLSIDLVHWSDGFDRNEGYKHWLLSYTVPSRV